MARRLLLHPFLFAAYPVVFLFAQNLTEDVKANAVVWPLLFVLAVVTVFFGLLRFIVRDGTKAAALTSIYVLLFFSYGHVFEGVRHVAVVNTNVFLLTLWLAIGVGGTVAVIRAKSLERLTSALNLIAGALVLMNVVPIVAHALKDHPPPPRAAEGLQLPDPSTVDEASKRDIYYIIFDRYANEKTLERLFDFDNSETLDYLESLGFYVAHDTAANHQKTGHSLASSLNMSYLNYLSKTYPPQSSEYAPIYRLLRDFKVERILKTLGYRYYHIGAWWNPTQENQRADVSYVYGNALSEFSQVLLKSTLWGPLSEEFGIARSFGFRPTQARRVEYQFEKVATVKNDPAPTFTFMHMLLPHPPIVFDAVGNLVSPEEEKLHSSKENYVNQLIYTNTRLRAMVDDLLSGPHDEDPIIIIQSDEGPHPFRLQRNEDAYDWFEARKSELREKLLILNAYYLPGVPHHDLYETISPVNSFRLVFNLYFDAHIPLLPDRSFVYQDRAHLFHFREVYDEALGIDRATHNAEITCSPSCLRIGGVPPP
jgi:hypothetical protein